jgi:hypothetical protein
MKELARVSRASQETRNEQKKKEGVFHPSNL